MIFLVNKQFKMLVFKKIYLCAYLFQIALEIMGLPILIY